MVATFALSDGVDVTYLNEPRFVAEGYRGSFKLRDLNEWILLVNQH